MKIILLNVIAALVLCTAAAAAGTDKTLVSWVTLTNPNLRAGSVLTLQRGSEFDGIVFAEKARGKWMAGSDFWKRTPENQSAYPTETGGSNSVVQMTIVYKGDTISLYRNGELYASYQAKNVDLLSGDDNQVVFGVRHEGGDGSIGGYIEDARIYARALSVGELKSLVPKKKSAIEPYAWWDFEGVEAVDRMGRFPDVQLSGKTKLAGGKLMLGAGASLVARRPYVPDHPAWPEHPPANWLTFHLAHPGPGEAAPGDPNCAFYWKGQYHLHYIYNHGGFNFAHVSSDDMVHWKWHETTLTRRKMGHGMFSGTGFFTKEGKPAIIYHGEGSGRNQIAIAQDDDLEIWSKPHPLKPRIRPDQDGSKIANWDPDAWLEGDTYYALSGGNPGSGKPVTLFKSADLKNWEYLGLFLSHDMPEVGANEDISCPNFFKIGNKRMLLCISHNMGCRYYLGEFTNERFVPDFHARMTWNGNHFFAPESVLTKDGRRVMWAWLAGMPIAPSGVQSLPRELELPADGVLRIRPLRELAQLRYDKRESAGITVKSEATRLLEEVDGDALELELKFRAPLPRGCGIDVLCDARGENGMRVSVSAEELRVGGVTAPLAIKPREDLTLRVFVDKNLVEVFANDVQAVAMARADWPPQNIHARLFAAGGEVTVESVTAWKMKTIYAGK